MKKTIVLDGDVYVDVEQIQVPLASDSGQMAVYTETSDATAQAAQILAGYDAYINGKKVPGTMVNHGELIIDMNGREVTEVKVPAGFTQGATVRLTDDIEKALAEI